ncbi:hypothetical protein [Thermoplasma volcanium GSS1]|uniref:SAM-dependent methyltransferase TRM5/TYW2-type domain-containing protein n=1 Tax=Thermoplasma volcanium (strain ATCC 51530 / DSM 4299 / JCM 9571 / NBRC 15438 / GSS1) TaxID=273116 RepID=Q97AI1_THEVO|nr:class I SAM-dependent methyltransferase family protein [Thermoplasma volcanium]BAB59971.1 hypothetical protein [Thermoplasma volcanium GSS1]
MSLKGFVKVERRMADRTIKMLQSRGYFDSDYEIRHEGDYVLIPVKDGFTGPVVVKDAEKKPKVIPASGSFDIIGTIAITKKDDVEFAKEILKTHKNIKSVYLDKGVKGKERIRDLVLLAGIDSTVALYRENGCIFKIDVSKSYFSPRLATERRRLVDSILDGEFIVDMFAGSGPISIEVAKKRRVKIISIDINCAAIESLQESMRLNSLLGTITPICGDARQLIKDIHDADRIIMNHPTDAFSFLPCALEALKYGGHINYYEILNKDDVTKRLADFNFMRLKVFSYHRVHSYSKLSDLISFDLIREG